MRVKTVNVNESLGDFINDKCNFNYFLGSENSKDIKILKRGFN